MSEKKKKKVITYNIMKPTMTANDELLLPNGKMYFNFNLVWGTGNIGFCISKAIETHSGLIIS